MRSRRKTKGVLIGTGRVARVIGLNLFNACALPTQFFLSLPHPSIPTTFNGWMGGWMDGAILRPSSYASQYYG